MGISTVTQKGQVTIPAEIRRRLGLETSDRVVFSQRKKMIIIEPFIEDITDFFNFHQRLGKKGLKPQELEKRVRKKVAAEIAAEGK